MNPPLPEHVAIVGAGFSGTLLAINLLRHGGPRATLIERRHEAGRGVAYATTDPGHLLNVRAANMSALPDQPHHFEAWLQRRNWGGGAFVPRHVYGDYLAELLHEVSREVPGRLNVLAEEATDIVTRGGLPEVRLSGGGALVADVAVLALGNLPPHPPLGADVATLGCDRLANDPWSPAALDGLGPGDDVLLVGSGLTMVDVALLLETRGFRGGITAISRRGLLPHLHPEEPQAVPPLPETPYLPASALLASVRRSAATLGWVAAIDQLRPHTQQMWRAAGAAERSRFLRHLRPWWDIHRHRLAPDVARRIGAMREGGQLEIAAGKLLAMDRTEGGVCVRWRPRGAQAAETRKVRRVINCTGPQGDVLRSHEPLLVNLLARGAVRADAQALGLDVTAKSEVLSADGVANPRLLALGPITRGAFWEIAAVPDIRVQTWSVARRLSNVHWVEGEAL